MSKSLDGQRIRIKGTSIETRVRYCTEAHGRPQVVTELFFHPEDPNIEPEIKPFINEDNPYGDAFDLDQIELQKPGGGWYTPKFQVR